jgi:hypothetical protein
MARATRDEENALRRKRRAARRADTPPAERPHTFLERLAISAYAAAIVRSAKVRRIVTVDIDGKPLREIGSDEMQRRVFERQGIEFDARGSIVCAACGVKTQRPKYSFAPRICPACRRRLDKHIRLASACLDCGEPVRSKDVAAKLAKGRAIRCHPCAIKESRKHISKATFAEAGKRGAAARLARETPADKARVIERLVASRTTESRRAVMKGVIERLGNDEYQRRALAARAAKKEKRRE